MHARGQRDKKMSYKHSEIMRGLEDNMKKSESKSVCVSKTLTIAIHICKVTIEVIFGVHKLTEATRYG